jgi:multiple sugar transport system ATP-binding protein
MTVRENLEFGMRIRKVPPAERDALVREAAGVLEIGHLLDRKPRQLSGGQRQRVALGRAIVRKPSVYLFDEPLSNLDAKLRVQMRGEIKRLQQRLQTTTVYVTHDQIEAMTMGSRISVMKDGKIQQVGAPLEIYDRPANLFVAAFIGAPPMNFVAATICDGGAALAAAKFSLPVPDELRAATSGGDGKKVVVGIRPEHVSDPSEARGKTAKLPAEIEIVEPLGDEVIVHARAGDEPLVYKTSPAAAPEAGQTCEIAVKLDRLHLFDATTEKRLSG